MTVDKLTIFKIKSTAKDFGDFIELQQPKKVAVEIPAGATYSVEVVVAFKEFVGKKKTHKNIPWMQFLNDGLPSPDHFKFESENRFPSAIVGLKFTDGGQDDFYAIVFGLAGESHINSEQIVRDFGIRVAMNICDEEKLKRVQSTRHAEVSTQSERQISSGSSFSVFDIDDEKEFLQAIAGAARNEFKFIQSFTGKESIAIKASKGQAINWKNLIERVHALSDAYGLRKFETTFPGYAKFHFETDKNVIKALDAQLMKSIIARDFTRAHLAPPEVVDYATCDFSYNQHDGRFEDLTLEDLLNSRRSALAVDADIGTMKSMKIRLWNVETGSQIRVWPAYRCIVAEVLHNGDTYILSNEQWKKVSNALQKEIDDYMPTIAIAGCAYLPHDVNIWNPAENKNQESVFNAAAKNGNEQLFLLDKGKIEIGGKRLYEVCDLLHTDRSLIQVKRFQNSSSSISHLFLQGRFYGDAFLTDEQCRHGMRQAIDKTLGAADAIPFLDIVPLKRGDLNANEFTIIFCLLAERDITLKDLPFMARYELMHSHRVIVNRLGMSCAVAFRRIKVEAKPKPTKAAPPRKIANATPVAAP